MSNKSFDQFMKDILTSGDLPNANEALKRNIADLVKEQGYDVTEDIKQEAFTSDELSVDEFKEVVVHAFVGKSMHTLHEMLVTGEVNEISKEHLDAIATKGAEMANLMNEHTHKLTGLCANVLMALGNIVIGSEIKRKDDDDEEGEL